MMMQRWLIPLAPALALFATAAAPVLESEIFEESPLALETSSVARADIALLVDALFTDEGVGETRAVLVLQNGETIEERYAPGYSADMRYVSWSMAKTVTAMLIGFLVDDGVLELDAPAPIAEW